MKAMRLDAAQIDETIFIAATIAEAEALMWAKVEHGLLAAGSDEAVAVALRQRLQADETLEIALVLCSLWSFKYDRETGRERLRVFLDDHNKDAKAAKAQRERTPERLDRKGTHLIKDIRPSAYARLMDDLFRHEGEIAIREEHLSALVQFSSKSAVTNSIQDLADARLIRRLRSDGIDYQPGVIIISEGSLEELYFEYLKHIETRLRERAKDV
jgi:hypothetical protein